MYYKNKWDEDINFALWKGKIFDSGCMKLSFGMVYYTNNQNTEKFTFQSLVSEYRAEKQRWYWLTISNLVKYIWPQGKLGS